MATSHISSGFSRLGLLLATFLLLISSCDLILVSLDTIHSLSEALSAPNLNWMSEMAMVAAVAVAALCAISLAFYAAVHAIGWVINGFART